MSKHNLTDFPNKGDDKKISLRNSNYPVFDVVQERGKFTINEPLFIEESGSFIPKPKVDSALIYFEILKKPRYKVNQNRFKIIVDTAFNQKRKMIRSSLKNIFPNTKLALQKVGIEETKRPQNIDLKYFCDLSLI